MRFRWCLSCWVDLSDLIRTPLSHGRDLCTGVPDRLMRGASAGRVWLCRGTRLVEACYRLRHGRKYESHRGGEMHVAPRTRLMVKRAGTTCVETDATVPCGNAFLSAATWQHATPISQCDLNTNRLDHPVTSKSNCTRLLKWPLSHPAPRAPPQPLRYTGMRRASAVILRATRHASAGTAP